jgi:uncharacterized protein YqgC (DUF456 family)
MDGTALLRYKPLMTPLLWVLSLILVGVGIAGTLLPGLPGTPLVFGGLLLAAWADGFQNVGAGAVIILAVMTVLAFCVDFISFSLGARGAGASREAVIGAALGTLVGIFFGLAGIVFGPFAGAVLGEYMARRNLAQAGRAGVATWLGFLLGIGVKLVLAFAMVGIFIIAYIL